jgi:hypothetical protein
VGLCYALSLSDILDKSKKIGGEKRTSLFCRSVDGGEETFCDIWPTIGVSFRAAAQDDEVERVGKNWRYDISST